MKGKAVALVVSLIAIAPLLAGSQKKDDPGRIRDGVLDEIDLSVSTHPAPGPLTLRPFDATKADAGSAKEGENDARKDAVRYIRSEGPKILADTLMEDLKGGIPFPTITAPDQPAAEGGLVVEGEFERIDPGSRAKRYWAGFGAGKSGITITGRVRDASGQVLATFRHTRNSGIGMGGGDYVKFLSDDTHDVAHDLAQFLKRWVTGGDLRKEAD